MAIGIKKRQDIFVRDGGRCAVCNVILHNDKVRWKELFYMQVDHIKPQSHGGQHDIDNLRATCKRCNSRRKDFTSSRLVSLFENKLKNAEIDVKKVQEELSCEALSNEQAEEIITLYEDFIIRTEIALLQLKNCTR